MADGAASGGGGAVPNGLWRQEGRSDIHTRMGEDISRAAPDRLRRWMRLAARVGHASVGVLYLLLGVAAVVASVDMRRVPTDSVGVFRVLVSDRVGRLVAATLVVGLIVDAIWQAGRTLHQRGPRRRTFGSLMERAVWLGSGAIHFGVAFAGIRVALGAPEQDGETVVQYWSDWVLASRHGETVVVVVGVGIVGVACVMVSRAWSGEPDRSLQWTAMHRRAGHVISSLARVSLAARAVILGIIGVFLVVVAIQHDPAEARGVAGALRSLRYREYGPVLVGILAVCFLANGVVEVVRARYRRRVP